MSIPSSPQAMVSVPREVIEQAEKLLQEDNRFTMAREFRALMARTTEQHQGEPMAWLYSRPEGQVEPVVTLTRASASDRGSWDETALCPCNDPGEVDRLRADLATVKADRDAYAQNAIDLRAQLAEANTAAEQLLQSRDIAREQASRRDAQLSIFNARLAPITGWTAETRSAVLEAFQEELNESCSYAWYDDAIADLMRLVEAIAAGAEPNAVVERDEQAAFEVAYCEYFNAQPGVTTPYTPEQMRESRDGDHYGEGANGKNLRWEGWQMRAAQRVKTS